MDSSSKFDFSSMGLPPKGTECSIKKVSYVVHVGETGCVPLVVPFGSLESVVMMALTAGMSVKIGVAYNSDFCIWKEKIEGILKSDV